MDKNSNSAGYQKEKRRKEELERKYKKITENIKKLEEEYQALLDANCKCRNCEE